MRRWIFVLLCACGGAFVDTGREPTTPVDRAFAAARAESTGHSTLVAMSTSLADLRAEAARHEERMDRVLDDLETAAAASGCTDAAALADIDRTTAWVRTVERAHRDTLDRCGDLEAARTECVSHRDEIDRTMAALEERWDAMCGP